MGSTNDRDRSGSGWSGPEQCRALPGAGPKPERLGSSPGLRRQRYRHLRCRQRNLQPENINCSIRESLARFKPVAEQALAADVRVRGYVSCLVACPYEGEIAPAQVLPVVRALFDMGCYEVSLGDTIGRGTPRQIKAVLTALLAEHDADQLALHCHDTYGMAAANIMAGLDLGIRTFDSSVGGAGGCPYAPGASGNVATEEVVYLLENEGFDTGVDLEELAATGRWLFEKLGKPVPSKVNQAMG